MLEFIMCGLADFMCEVAVWRNLLIIGGLQSWIWVATATWYSYLSDSIRSCKNLASWIDWFFYHRCEPLVPHHSRFIRKISPYLEVGGSSVSPILPHGTTYHKNLFWFLLHKLVLLYALIRHYRVLPKNKVNFLLKMNRVKFEEAFLNIY